MRRIFIAVKHFVLVALVLAVAGFGLIVSQHGHIGFGTQDLAFKVGGEGPYVALTANGYDATYIQGNREQGFYLDVRTGTYANPQALPVLVAKDGSRFDVQLAGLPVAPPQRYTDDASIFVMSDLEGNFIAFRDFLQAHGVIDAEHNWQFANNHLVLVGDMVDRGYSVTQLLWFIYRLEQQAMAAGGRVHYILGNHELKNLQGNFTSAAKRYVAVAGILGLSQADLLGQQSFLGQWLASKHVIERINGHVFVHGGLHPQIAELGLTLEEINALVKRDYRQFYYPHKDHSEAQTLLTSTKTGPAWYRGYFRDDLSQQEIAAPLIALGAKAVVVGHTLQFNVNKQHKGKVLAIDVKHPQDYSDSFPFKRSQGLLIENDAYYRLLDTGEREPI